MEAIQENSVGFPPIWKVPHSFTDARDLFVGYLLLDAWIGNGDRHHENWGFIRRQNFQSTQILHQSGETTKAPIMGARKEHQNKNRSQ